MVKSIARGKFVTPLGGAASIPFPDGVVAFRLPTSGQRVIVEALSGHAPLRFTADVFECRLWLQERRSPALVVSIPRSVSAPDFQELLDLRAEFPLVAMIGLFIAKESDLSALARLAAAGVADVLPVEQPSIAHHIRSTLSRAQAESLSSRVWRLAAVNVTDSAASLLRPALRLAHSPISLPVLANALRMHERSVRKYCHANALPSPQWIIGWARSLLVAYYLEESGRSIQSIATLLGYKSSSLLANHLKRYTGKTASVLREESPLRTVGRLLESALAPPPGSPHRAS